MALYCRTVSVHQAPSSTTPPPPPPLIPKQRPLFKLPSSTPSSPSSASSSSFKALAQTERADGRKVAEEDPPASSSGSLSSARTQLDFLEQLTAPSSSTTVNGYKSDSISGKLTIRDQLAQLVGDRREDFSVSLGKKNLKKVSEKFLTISQKRNIKRQAYLDEVSQRNDSVFLATIGAFVILPPVVILGIAIITGYVQLFP
ncbi:uncharacterized protein LOC115730853 [Rhodamnia argentea]|uniref:Uncharacterized protein LOC115730853 n=1 Tax=Rhodamnia argentea TaxID=178133 RepID=A0ABM3HZ46_9MYRT|nr:uncharacterized protein LOC115730853 [Rhodamnia argentea]